MFSRLARASRIRSSLLSLLRSRRNAPAFPASASNTCSIPGGGRCTAEVANNKWSEASSWTGSPEGDNTVRRTSSSLDGGGGDTASTAGSGSDLTRASVVSSVSGGGNSSSVEGVGGVTM